MVQSAVLIRTLGVTRDPYNSLLWAFRFLSGDSRTHIVGGMRPGDDPLKLTDRAEVPVAGAGRRQRSAQPDVVGCCAHRRAA